MRASAPHCRRCGWRWKRERGWCCCRTWAAAGGKFDPEFSLAPVAAKLSELLGKPVALVADWLGGVSVAAGSVVLCENVRFNKGEKKDAEALARQMAALCDVFVMDAFGTRTGPRPAPTGWRNSRRWPAPARCWWRSWKRSSARWRSQRGRCSDRRRLQGVHQAHHPGEPAHQGRQADRRRRIANTFWPPPASGSANRCTRRTCSRSPASCCSRRARAGRRSRCGGRRRGT